MNNDINKYHNGKIYTIRSAQTDKYYIGSTTQPLYKRFYEHKRDYKLFLDGKFHNVSSFDIVKFDDCYIELLEEFKCENKEQLTKKEGQTIRLYINDIVNKRIEGRSKQEHYIDNKDKIKEIQKQYYTDNKEIKKQYNEQYYDDNKEKILAKLNCKYICQCGGKYTQVNKTRHLKSNKHQKYLTSQND